MVLILYDYTLLIPTQVIQRLVDHLSQRTLTQSNFVWDMVLLVGSAILNYLTAFYWQLRLFQSSVHFKATLQGQAFRKLVAMRRPFFEIPFRGPLDALYDRCRWYGRYGWLWDDGAPVWRWLVCLYYSDHVFHFLAINLDFLYSDDLPHRLDLFLSRKQEDYVEQNREAVAQLNDEVLESIEGIRVMRAYSKRDQQVKQFQKKTASLSKTGDKIASIQYSFGSLSPVVYWILDNLAPAIWRTVPSKRAVEPWQVIGLTAVFGLFLIEPMWMMADLILVYQIGQMSYKN